MRSLRCRALAGLFLACCLAGNAETLTFIPQQDTLGVYNYRWQSVPNWFKPDGLGGLTPAGRLPREEETAIITDRLDAENTLRVKTLIATDNTAIRNGNFAVQNIQMLSGSSFSNSTITVLTSIKFGGTNCVFSRVNLTVLQIAVATFAPIPPATAASLFVENESTIYDLGQILMADATSIIGRGSPESRLVVQPDATLITTGSVEIRGATTNALVIDNSGLISAEDGTLRFGTGLDWFSDAGTGLFRAATNTALMFFEGRFKVPANATSLFVGAGICRFGAGGTIDGTLQAGFFDPASDYYGLGNLEILDSMDGQGHLDVAGGPNRGASVVWASGTLSFPSLTLAPGTTLTLADSPERHELSGCSIHNEGACRMLALSLTMTGGATIDNSELGLFEVLTNSTFAGPPPPTGGVFRNAGTFRIPLRTMTYFGDVSSQGGPDFENTGLVDIPNSVVSLAGGSTSGEFRLGSNTLVQFWSGPYTVKSNAQFTGSGLVTVSKGSAPSQLVITGPASAGTIVVSGFGSLVGPTNAPPDLLRITNLNVYNGGSLTNGGITSATLAMQAGSVISGTTVTVTKAASFLGSRSELVGARVTLRPGATASVSPKLGEAEGSIVLSRGSILYNSGELRLENGAGIIGETAPASALTIAAGAALSSAGATLVKGSADAPLVIDNGGTIRADSGTLRFEEGIQWQSASGFSTLNAASPGSAILFASPLEIPANLTTVFEGHGTNLLAAGARIDGIAQLGGYGGQQGMVPGLLEVAGSVTGAGSIRVLGEPNKTNVLKWTEGVLGCSYIMIDFGGSLRIGPAARTLSGCSLYNSGLCELFSADLTLANAALLKNNAGAVFEVAVPGVIRASAASPGSFYNGGLLRKAIPGDTDFGTSASVTGPAFSNSGTLEIQAGQMAFYGDWVQTGGLTSVDAGATLTGKLLQLQAGVLSGPGPIQGKIDNAGILLTGSNPGTLVLESGSEFVQRASGKIGIQLGGTTAGTQYDVLRVQGPATLGGQVEIAFLNGYEPQPTDTFKILTASAITGKFASIAGTAPPGKTWVATYTPTEVILSLGTLATVSRPVYRDGRIGFAFATTAGPTYTVEKSDSLNPIGWYAVQTYPGDGNPKSFQEAITPPEGYYRVTVK